MERCAIVVHSVNKLLHHRHLFSGTIGYKGSLCLPAGSRIPTAHLGQPVGCGERFLRISGAAGSQFLRCKRAAW